MALREPFSTKNGTTLDQPIDEEKFIVREPYGIEVIQQEGQRQAELDILGQKILAAIDGSASGHIHFTEITRSEPRRDWRAAAMRLVKLRVLSMNENDYFWRHQTKSQIRKARRR